MPNYNNAPLAPPDVSVVIVAWQSRDFIDRCLAPFVDHPDEIEVLVYDNASSDGIKDYISSNYPWVRLIAGRENLGFGGGNNAAIPYCRGELLLLLNPDAFLSDLSPIWEMAKALKADISIGAVGPQLVHEDGRHQVGDAGWTTTLRSMAGHTFWLHRVFAAFPSIYISNPQLLRRDSVDVDWICGASLMIRKSLFQELKGFSDDIFMYGEDVELGDRVRASGHRVVYLPKLKVLHLQGATQKSEGTVYYSTRWLDARAQRFFETRSWPACLAFKLIASMGFLYRSLVLRVIGLFRIGARAQASLMLNYGMHALKLTRKNYGPK